MAPLRSRLAQATTEWVNELGGRQYENWGPTQGAESVIIARHPVAVVLVVALGLVLLAPGTVTARPGWIVLRPGLTLAEQFGYAPEYTQNAPTFDTRNTPNIRSRSANQHDTSFVHRLEAGAWVRHDCLQALRSAYPDFTGTVFAGGWGSDRVEFDAQDRAYSVLTIRLADGHLKNVLVYSTDACQTWGVVELPYGDAISSSMQHNQGNVIMEHDSGRGLQGPPLLAVWRRTAPWEGTWASVNDLFLIQPQWAGDVLALRRPVLVSRRYLGMVLCSGGASFAVTKGDRSFFVYSTVVPPGSATTPTYAATYDHSSNTVGRSVLVAGARPANDAHNTPGICMDSGGILHVVSGAHGWPFRYAHSLKPRSTAAWTRHVPVLTSGYRDATTDADGRGRQTYLSLVCGPDDVVHVVSRQWRRDVGSYYRGAEYAALVHQRLPRGHRWSTPTFVVVPPAAGYGNFYHKLTVDRLGRLFVSCSYFSHRDPLETREDRRFHHRMVLISEDGGARWRFATTADFVAGMEAFAAEARPAAPQSSLVCPGEPLRALAGCGQPCALGSRNGCGPAEAAQPPREALGYG